MPPAPGVPRPGEETRAPRFSLRLRSHRFRNPLVVGHERRFVGADRRQALLEPFQRGGRQGGWSARPAGWSGSPASGACALAAGQLLARERSCRRGSSSWFSRGAWSWCAGATVVSVMACSSRAWPQ